MNTCSINPNGGPIQVVLTADNGLRTAGKFELFEHVNGNWQVIPTDKHEVQTGDEGQATFLLNTATSQLENKALGWLLNSCRQISSAEQVKNSISFWQDGEKKRTLNPTVHTGNYPSCDGQSRKVGNNILFRFEFVPSLNINVWESMEE